MKLFANTYHKYRYLDILFVLVLYPAGDRWMGAPHEYRILHPSVLEYHGTSMHDGMCARSLLYSTKFGTCTKFSTVLKV